MILLKIVVTLSAAAILLAAAGAAQATPARNVVLVHGAFTDATSWDKVAKLLRRKGLHVTQVSIPLTSLDADVAVTRGAGRAERADRTRRTQLGRCGDRRSGQ
jgi:predicted alpha/beta-hydrolase family hydrolase